MFTKRIWHCTEVRIKGKKRCEKKNCWFTMGSLRTRVFNTYLGYGNVVVLPRMLRKEICHQSRWRDWGYSDHFHYLRGWRSWQTQKWKGKRRKVDRVARIMLHLSQKLHNTASSKKYKLVFALEFVKVCCVYTDGIWSV